MNGVGRKRVERIISKIQENKCPALRDMRGQHLNRSNKVPEYIIHQVDYFIKSFRKLTSHYSRNKNGNKYYLYPELSMSKMDKMYLEKYEPDNKKYHLDLRFFAAFSLLGTTIRSINQELTPVKPVIVSIISLLQKWMSM